MIQSFDNGTSMIVPFSKYRKLFSMNLMYTGTDIFTKNNSLMSLDLKILSYKEMLHCLYTFVKLQKTYVFEEFVAVSQI